MLQVATLLSGQVDFETVLDLAPVMSNRRAGPQLYELYAVIVHVGHSLNAGHYYCFVRASNGLWHRMDDTHVSQVGCKLSHAAMRALLYNISKSHPYREVTHMWSPTILPSCCKVSSSAWQFAYSSTLHMS